MVHLKCTLYILNAKNTRILVINVVLSNYKMAIGITCTIDNCSFYEPITCSTYSLHSTIDNGGLCHSIGLLI